VPAAKRNYFQKLKTHSNLHKKNIRSFSELDNNRRIEMELTKALKGRRSIRSYKTDVVSREKINELIEAAILAPSWKNSQVSRFYVSDNPDTTKSFLDCMPDFNKKSMENVPAVIVSTVVKNRSGFERDGSYTTHLKDGWQYFDNGLSVGNMCLKAYELGLGTLIMGIYDVDKVRDFFDIPETEEIVSVVAVGYAAIEPAMPKRKTVDEITTYK